MKRNNIAHVFLVAMVITFGLSSASLAAEDGGADWVKAMETHAGLKGLTPLAGCAFALEKYTLADGTFTAQTDIAEESLMGFIRQLWEASKSVSTSGMSKARTTDIGRGPKAIEDIAELDLSQLWQIRWTYHYNAGSQSKLEGTGKHMVITIDDKRHVSFSIVADRN